MAELLVRVVDKHNDDPYLDAKLFKAGDVIAIQRDGWVWGRQEQLNPEWRILKVPGVSPEDLTAFLAPEPETDPSEPSRMLQRRAFRLDLSAPILTALQAARDRALVKVPMTLQQLLELKAAKPPIDDPNVLD